MVSPRFGPGAAGIANAAQRLERHEVPFDLSKVEDSLELASGILNRQEAPERSVELATEIVAIAAMMREVNDEPQLTFFETVAFLESLRVFINSWWHE